MRSVFLICLIHITGFSVTAQEYNAFDAEGKRHGKWQKKYENSDQLRYEGTFEHGKEVGEFKFYKPTNGEFPTAIKFYSKDTDTVKVKYFTKKGRVISQGQLINKDRVGTWQYYHNEDNKIMMIEQYQSGKLHGYQRTYFKNGQITEDTPYYNGNKHGKSIMYSDTGVVLKEFIYEHGQLHGLTKYYDTDGTLMIEGKYKRDRKDSIWNYYTNGKLTEQKLFPVSKRGL
ncbi:toxin-antitoxin system YwqK family antitoxin [Aquimarina pacifica]|uniref:toxin-antitoxin system YwqK family antitoxin n=1 Tax=Aquimarina pacifica TaxID=1296415 RepID=UPI0004712828|nr:hypothetical protein [Aquimarina pacifica]